MRSVTMIKRNEQGAVLLTSLMILLLLTILGINSMSNNIVQERMVSNMHDRNIGFQAAESALRQGEAWVAARNVLPDVGTIVDGVYLWDFQEPDTIADNGLSWWFEGARDAAWWDANAVKNTGGDTIGDVAVQPAFIMEMLPPKLSSLEAGVSLDDAEYYLQVTSRATGGSANAVVLLQTVYKW
ncbi:MAG: PilX N-terminal domain-containing pilus assembly protein [Candidatus Sedimenticola sp. 6PFRAG1]